MSVRCVRLALGMIGLTLLPQVRTEDLDQTDLKGRDLAVHEDTREIQLDL